MKTPQKVESRGRKRKHKKGTTAAERMRKSREGKKQLGGYVPEKFYIMAGFCQRRRNFATMTEYLCDVIQRDFQEVTGVGK